MLLAKFFNRDPLRVARDLLGKVMRVKYDGMWLSAQIIETEAYCLDDKGSHASQGFTEKRKALFMPAGTIYMYHSRGEPSMNISTRGKGSAVLIKSAKPYFEKRTNKEMIAVMQSLNPIKTSGKTRMPERLCSGQTLVCRALNLRVNDWDQKQFQKNIFRIDDTNYAPEKIIQTTRMGIPEGRDAHLPYRFIDYEARHLCTSNPLTKRSWALGKEYCILDY